MAYCVWRGGGCLYDSDDYMISIVLRPGCLRIPSCPHLLSTEITNICSQAWLAFHFSCVYMCVHMCVCSMHVVGTLKYIWHTVDTCARICLHVHMKARGWCWRRHPALVCLLLQGRGLQVAAHTHTAFTWGLQVAAHIHTAFTWILLSKLMSSSSNFKPSNNWALLSHLPRVFCCCFGFVLVFMTGFF